jgi:hypothetical protein
MKKSEVQAAVDAEIEGHRAKLSSLTPQEVQALYAAQVARYGAGADAYNALRTEVSAALQLKNQPPYAIDPVASKAAVTVEHRDALHDAADALVTDQHRVLSDRAKRLDPMHSDARHFAQKCHGQAVWREVARVIAAAGITAVGGGAS